jgi:hypothetical protein
MKKVTDLENLQQLVDLQHIQGQDVIAQALDLF